MQCASRSRVATCSVIQHLSHPMVRQPRAPDWWVCSFQERTGESRLFCLSPRKQQTHHVPKCASGRTMGILPELHQSGAPVNQQTPQTGLSAGAHHKVTSGRIETALRPKKTILCVDDNEQVLSVRTFLLETRGYRVIAALSSQQALEVVEQSLPGSLDLLLCDLIMPQMDGNELVRRAKQLHPGLPAMIVSGTVNAFDRASCADVFLPKGASSPAEMIERIRVLVARKRGPRKAFHSQPHSSMLTAAVAS
jgi:two-component system response regulator CpxR